MSFLGVNWGEVFEFLLKLLVAFVLTLPVAWEREQHSRSMGLRTFPLVAVASCGYLLMGAKIAAENSEALMRVVQGLMTGMGFIGGGAILKQEGNVHGTATAASIWATGVVGAAVALGRYEIAIATSLISYLVLRFLMPIKHRMHQNDVENQ